MVVGESRVSGLSYREAPVFLLTTSGGLARFFSIESFECFLQKDPRYFKGVPLSYKEFVFDIPDYAAGDMAESKVVDLSELEGLEYS
jgi:hypothetical protein